MVIKKMVIKEKIFIGVLILVIVLSIGSLVIMSNLNSEDISGQMVYEEEQSGNLNIGIIETSKNSGGLNENN